MTSDAVRFLDVVQVAERLGTTQRFVSRLTEERRITFHRFGKHVRIVSRLTEERRITFHRFGKHVRIREDDLDAYIAAGRVETGSRAAYRRAS
jgi:excisionase family DNA binding protein